MRLSGDHSSRWSRCFRGVFLGVCLRGPENRRPTPVDDRQLLRGVGYPPAGVEGAVLDERRLALVGG